MREYYQVPVAEVVRETGDACSLVLDVPPPLELTFAYRPGQFVTVRVPSDRTGSVARCYSLSSCPVAGEQPAITVKRTAGGYASNWILEYVTAGTVLDLLPPAGTFSPRSLDGDFLLFAAGSGITPVMSILKSALAAGGRGRIVLFYANRDEHSVIFGPELRRLAAGTAGRLAVVHWLDSLLGVPTAAAITALARPYASYHAFICGPDPYLAAVRDALGRLSVPGPRVHVERFVSLAENPFEETPSAGGTAATLSVTLDEATTQLPWPAGTRMLDVLIGAGLDAPYSCRQGICGACACQLTGGEVEMVHNEVLEAADIADGYILACQAVSLTPQVSITY
jgi:3-ketosteroid 9alpha-monooxygenase subunit B